MRGSKGGVREEMACITVRRMVGGTRERTTANDGGVREE